MNLDIRIEKDPSVPALLTRHVHDEHHRRRPEVFKPFDYEACREWYGRVLAGNETTCLVAYLEEDPVGYVLLVHHQSKPGPFLVDGYQTMFIDQMGVRDGFRSRGIGKRLMKEVFSFCRAKGMDRVELTVWVDNDRARSFYDRMGFEVYIEKRGRSV